MTTTNNIEIQNIYLNKKDLDYVRKCCHIKGQIEPTDENKKKLIDFLEKEIENRIKNSRVVKTKIPNVSESLKNSVLEYYQK